jgi:chromate transporter
MKHPSLFNLCKTAFYIGTIAYGGPANLVHFKKIMVHDHGWIHEHEFLDTLALAQVLPGATGVSMMAHVGYKYKKFTGGLLMPIFYILPATISILPLAWAYFKFGELSAVRAVMSGLGALVVALLLNAVIHLGQAIFKPFDRSSIKGFLIAALTFAGMYFFKMNTVLLILGSGALGILLYHFTHEFEHEIETSAPTEIQTEVHLEKRIHPWDFMSLVVAGAIIVMILISSHALASLFLSFSQIGLFSFGGGYAAIPLMQHQMVDQLQWLTLHEFRDGIALGQITPGPVSTVAAFVGYKLAGLIGAFVSVVAIFLAPVGTMIALSSVHAKVRRMKLTRVVIKGFSTGFMGLLLAVTLQFALKSLVGWETWLVFAVSLFVMLRTKKDPLWLIFGTLVFSLLFIR